MPISLRVLIVGTCNDIIFLNLFKYFHYIRPINAVSSSKSMGAIIFDGENITYSIHPYIIIYFDQTEAGNIIQFLLCNTDVGNECYNIEE